MTLSRQRERSAEYSLSRFSRQARVNLAADQLITVCKMSGFMYAFLLLDNLQSDILVNSGLLVSACAILYTAICCLVSETILLTSPTSNSFCSQPSVSDGSFPSSKTTSWFIIYLDRDVYARAPCSSSHFLARIAPLVA